MHDAVAATEVVCDASRKLVANAMHCQTTRLQAPRGVRVGRSVVLLLSVLETDEKKREWRVVTHSESRFSVFCLWLAERVFPLQRQATSKVSIDIFVRFPLASSAGRSVHTPGSLKPQPPRFAEKVVYQLSLILHDFSALALQAWLVRTCARCCWYYLRAVTADHCRDWLDGHIPCLR